LRNRSLRRAEANIVVGELMARKVETFGVAAARVHVIANWCNDEDIKPIAPADNPLREQWDLKDKFVFGYSGNLGRAHEYDTVLAAAERLRDDTRIVFLMIGGGKHFEELSNAVKARGLNRSFRFMPYQEQARLPYSLGVPDVHWLSLNPKLEGLIVPSKFYGIAAAGKPIVVLGDSTGELARLARQYDCGVVITPSDSGALVRTLQRFSAEPELVSAMGLRARTMLDASFARHQGLERWQQLLEQLERSPQNHSRA
jgi:colanic acid biosynthesis glycosyl transferase WcaI